VLLYPNLGGPVPAAGDQVLNVYFSLQAAKGRALSSLTASVVRDRETLLTLPVVLGESNAEQFVQLLRAYDRVEVLASGTPAAAAVRPCSTDAGDTNREFPKFHLGVNGRGPGPPQGHP
jgi:hypothetical protein